MVDCARTQEIITGGRLGDAHAARKQRTYSSVRPSSRTVNRRAPPCTNVPGRPTRPPRNHRSPANQPLPRFRGHPVAQVVTASPAQYPRRRSRLFARPAIFNARHDRRRHQGSAHRRRGIRVFRRRSVLFLLIFFYHRLKYYYY